MPIAQVVAPAELSAESPFDKFKARPYFSAVEIFGNDEKIERCFEWERSRLLCATELLKKQPWNFALIRLSLFDQLSHLYGVGFLQDGGYKIRERLKEFLSILDDWFSELWTASDRVVIMSAFSHVACRARLNLNELLYEGGFLHFQMNDETTSRRLASLALLRNEDDTAGGAAVTVKEIFPYNRSNCRTAVFEEKATVAASPVSGCIFVNARDRFVRGIVAPDEVAETRANVRDYLSARLQEKFGEQFSIWSKAENPSAFDQSPDLMIHVPSVELHNTRDLFLRAFDKPRSTHCPIGFIWSSFGELPEVVSSTDVWQTVR